MSRALLIVLALLSGCAAPEPEFQLQDCRITGCWPAGEPRP